MRTTRLRAGLVVSTLLVSLAFGCSKAEKSARHAFATAPAGAAATATGGDKSASLARKPMLEIRVELVVDVSSAREASELTRSLTEHAARAAGFVEHATSDAHGARVVLRVPPAELDAVRALLTAHGTVARESRSAKDVTDAVMDVDARVLSSKKEETRLLDLLDHKTGTLADVLAVERALADVRERIERLEAEQRAAHGRVDLATVEVALSVHGAADEAPLGHQLAVAAREGVAFARDVAIGTATTTLRAAPTLLPLGFGVVLAVRALRRRRASA